MGMGIGNGRHGGGGGAQDHRQYSMGHNASGLWGTAGGGREGAKGRGSAHPKTRNKMAKNWSSIPVLSKSIFTYRNL